MARLLSRVTATAAVTAVIGGALALSAPSAGATSTSGVLTAWGSNTAGQTDVPAAAQSGVQAIAAGSSTAYALKDGAVYGWGSNTSGETNIPAAAQSGVVAIDAADSTAIALKSDGSVVTWGWGGQAAVPSNLSGVTQVAATDDGGLALQSDHTVRTWGVNWNNPTYYPVPAGVQGHAVAVDGGFQYSAALTDTGSVVTWGEPLSSAPWRATPDAAKSGVVKMTASTQRIAAIKADGSVVTWGMVAIDPVPAAAMSGVVDVAVGDDWAIALKSDGSLVSWGNDHGQKDIPAVAGYQVSDLAAGSDFAMTIHQPASPPTVTHQPNNTYVLVGQSGSFTATASGDPSPTVQWQRAVPDSDQFTDIPGATATTYTTGAVGLADTYSRYRAVFTGPGGSVTTSPASLYVEQAAPPTPALYAPNGAVGEPYFFTIPVTGVLNPAVTKTSGSLPPGVALNADGSLTGTPTAIGNYTFQVRTNGLPQVENVTVRVQQPATLSGTAPDGETSLQYQWVPTMTGSASLSLVSGALPDGVRISNQLLTGVPIKTGVFTFTVQAANGYGTPATLTQTVTIRRVPSISLPPSGALPAGTIGTPYAFQFSTTGYPTPTVTKTTGLLPDGLSIDTTGKITGTPTKAGTFGFTAKAANGTSQDASTYATIAIQAPSPVPTLTGAPPDAVRNTAYSYTFALSGNPTTLTVTKTAGALPPGLTLTGATLAGTPTDNGTYTFTLTATNHYGTADLPVTMTVGTVPVFGADAPTATVGAPYSYAFPVTASPDAVVTGGTPPAGLTLSGGTLSGTPAKAGRYTVTVTATNQFGTATKTQQLTVNPATTGEAKVINPPASVQPGATESDDTIGVFGEKANQTLTTDLKIAGTTIPAGTKVNSYYVHADAIGAANTDHPFAGTVAFGTKVLAVATSTADLQASTPAFGVTGTTYSTSPDQGLEYNDAATLTTQDTVSMTFHVYNTADAIRVITLAP